MKTNQFTPLIRVTSSEVNTIDTLITQSITLFGRHHRCETSHTSPPIPIQCPDVSIEGTKPPTVQIGQSAPQAQTNTSQIKCPLEHLKCPFCEGNHLAWSLK
jgi:hypothetical protein